MPNEFKQLTKAEESVMQALWKIGQGYVRDVMNAMPAPQPHYNTVSTLIKILAEKKFVTAKTVGNAILFTPAMSREDYSKRFARKMLSNYFGGSLASFVSFFAEEQMDMKELDEIISILKKKKGKS